MARVDSRPPAPSGTLLTVERGMQVLRAFRSDRAALGNAELVRRTGLSKATVSRLTSTLLQLGYLRHAAGSREFELAAAPLAIGHSFVASSDLLQVCQSAMQALADELNVSVALGVGDDIEMLYVAYRASRSVSTLRLGVGSVLPMGTTAIGQAYLWGLAPDSRAGMLARLLEASAPRAEALDAGLRAGFEQLKAEGSCVVLAGYQRDAFGVAVPLRIGRHGVPMAMSCGRAGMKIDLAAEHARITPPLQRAARNIEKLLADFDGRL